MNKLIQMGQASGPPYSLTQRIEAFMGKDVLSVNMFGSLQVYFGDEEVVLPTDKARALLAYICVEEDESFRRDRLASMFWSELSQERAKRNLRQGLYRLKQALSRVSPTLEAELLTVDRKQLVIHPERWDSDVSQWTKLLQSAGLFSPSHPMTETQRLSILTEAIQLHKGEFLAGLLIEGEDTFDEWLQCQRSRFHQQHISVLARLAELHRKRCEYELADQYVLRWLSLEPWNEEAHRQRMLVLVTSGQRSAALAQYQRCVEQLLAAFQADPTEETVQLFERIHYEELEIVTPHQTSTGAEPFQQLPPRPSFLLGRTQETNKLKQQLLLPGVHIVTLLGVGGIGKTSVAVELLHQIAEEDTHFPDGIYAVSLVGLTHPQQVPSALAESLGLTTAAGEGDIRQRCLDFLRTKQALLYWDNFEHVAEATTLVAELQQKAPSLKQLFTSRVPLLLSEEHKLTLEGLRADDARSLFVHSALKVEPDFELQEEQQAVERICELANGIPLAIELAARWVHMLDCLSIVEELSTNLSLLDTQFSDMPRHHRSMQNIFEQSWQRLSPDEQEAFASLSVFCGQFDLKAAQTVLALPLQTIATLCERSLLKRTAKRRLMMLQLLHRFASEKCERLPQKEELFRRHIQYFLGLLQEHKDGFAGQFPQRTRQFLHLNLDNIRMAWQRAANAGQEHMTLMAQAAEGLERLCQSLGLVQECEDMFALAAAIAIGETPTQERVDAHNTFVLFRVSALVLLGYGQQASSLLEQLPEPSQLPLFLRAKFRELEGHIFLSKGRFQPASEAFAQARQHYEACSHFLGQSDTINGAALVYYRTSQSEAALALLEQGLEQDQVHLYRRGLAQKLNMVGLHKHTKDTPEQCLSYVHQALTIAQELESPYDQALFLNNMAIIERKCGYKEDALQHLQASCALCRQLGLSHGVASTLNNISIVHWQLKHYDASLECMKEALFIRRERGQHGEVGLILGNMGKLYKDMGQYPQAISILEEAFQMESLMENKREIARIRGILGEVFGAMKEWDKALAQLELGIHMLRELAFVPYLCWQLTTYAEYLFEVGRFGESALTNQEAHESATRINRTEMLERSKRLSERLGEYLPHITKH